MPLVQSEMRVMFREFVLCLLLVRMLVGDGFTRSKSQRDPDKNNRIWQPQRT